jgi:hypothetical protein
LPQPQPQPAAGIAKPTPAKKKVNLAWVIGILVVLLLGAAGLGVAGYVFAPRLVVLIKSG